jgi:hypothetical protein
MCTVGKFDLDSGIKNQAKRFEQALLEQRLADQYQQSLGSKREKSFDISQLSILLIGGLGSFLLAVAFFRENYIGAAAAAIMTVAVVSVWGVERLIHFSNKAYHKQQQLLLTKEAVRARKEILDNIALHLAWVLALRVEGFNRNFGTLTEVSHEDWRAWVVEHMTRRHQEVAEEIKACPLYHASVRDLSLNCAIDRLRHYLMLPPDDFQRLFTSL